MRYALRAGRHMRCTDQPVSRDARDRKEKRLERELVTCMGCMIVYLGPASRLGLAACLADTVDWSTSARRDCMAWSSRAATSGARAWMRPTKALLKRVAGCATQMASSDSGGPQDRGT